MWSVVDNIPLVAQEYPASVKAAKSYRSHLFNWKIPYTHLRTCLGKHFENLEEDAFKMNGAWMKSGADNPLFYELIERVEPDRIYCNREIICMYNDANPLNDYKIKPKEQNFNASQSYKKFSIVVPTMWRVSALFTDFLKQLVDCVHVDEIIIINNDKDKTPADAILQHAKIRMLTMPRNIYVNPAWNLGVSVSSNDAICIMNDDITFDTRLFDKVYAYIIESTGVIGLSPGLAQFGQREHADSSITINTWNNENTFGFGCLMFVHKKAWQPIPESLKIYYGDNYIFDSATRRQLNIYTISDLSFTTEYAQTTSDKSITHGFLEKEHKLYGSIMANYTPLKKILVAIPTAKYIEVETFKSLWDLDVPEGYTLDFQYFFGYDISQIRNLIADWAKRYDYLLSVDSDIILPRDALSKMIAADKDIISGLYIQRIPNTHTLEVYMSTANGGCTNIPYALIKDRGVVEIVACGMGCALIKSTVFQTLQYPHFFYKSALTRQKTISEDVYFCTKARAAGFSVWADASILCDHKGTSFFKVQTESRLQRIADQDLLPKQHADYLKQMSINPKVIYDIGACVRHWTRKAEEVWPSAEYYLIDAAQAVQPFLKDYKHAIALLSDADGKTVDFYEDANNPGGNSYYLETTGAFNDSHKSSRISITLDTLVKQNRWKLPDLIKLDVQGAELDILRGAQHTLSACTDIILEAQHVEYNAGAPQFEQVRQYLESINFSLVNTIVKHAVDADYHFTKNKIL